MEKKAKDKDTLNLTFILQVINYFVVGNFLSEQGKNVKKKRLKGSLFGAWKPVFFRHAQIVLPVWGLQGNHHFFAFVYLI